MINYPRHPKAASCRLLNSALIRTAPTQPKYLYSTIALICLGKSRTRSHLRHPPFASYLPNSILCPYHWNPQCSISWDILPMALDSSRIINYSSTRPNISRCSRLHSFAVQSELLFKPLYLLDSCARVPVGVEQLSDLILANVLRDSPILKENIKKLSSFLERSH